MYMDYSKTNMDYVDYAMDLATDDNWKYVWDSMDSIHYFVNIDKNIYLICSWRSTVDVINDLWSIS